MNRLAALAVLLVLAPAARADKLVLVAGGGDGPDGSPPETAKLVQPFGVSIGLDGTAYVVEMAKGERLRMFNTFVRKTVTVAGALGEKGHSGDGGDRKQARFNGM